MYISLNQSLFNSICLRTCQKERKSKVDFLLTKEQQEMTEMVEEFAKREIAPLTQELDENQTFLPKEIWKKMADLNLIGVQLPEEYGGLGLGAMEALLIRQAYCRGGGCSHIL